MNPKETKCSNVKCAYHQEQASCPAAESCGGFTSEQEAEGDE